MKLVSEIGYQEKAKILRTIQVFLALWNRGSGQRGGDLRASFGIDYLPVGNLPARGQMTSLSPIKQRVSRCFLSTNSMTDAVPGWTSSQDSGEIMKHSYGLASPICSAGKSRDSASYP